MDTLSHEKRNLYVNFIWQLIGRGNLVVLASLLKPDATWKQVKVFAKLQSREISRLRDALRRLARRRRIRIVENLNDISVQLTPQGREELQKQQFQELAIPVPHTWDGTWRMVIFDVPEEIRYIRDVLREKLQKLGFYQVQKSVFLYPYPCEQEMEFLKQCLGAEYHVHYFEVRIPHKSYEHHLKKHFFSDK